MLLQSELWGHDRNLMVHMLDRLIIAKLVEAEGKELPDTFNFDSGNYGEAMEMMEIMETVRDFLEMSGIGTLEQRGVSAAHYATFALNLYNLEEIYRYPLSPADKIRVKEITDRFCTTADTDFSMFEGKTDCIGCRIYIRMDCLYGFAFEFCDGIRVAHRHLEDLIKIQRTGKRGEE